MKKCGVFILLFIIVFPLCAQTNKNILMYVPAVSGTGSASQDNDIFLNLITRELIAWGSITLVETSQEADYSLTGTLHSPSPAVHLLQLILADRNSVALFDQTIRYLTMEEANGYIPYIMFDIIFQAFANKADEDESLTSLEILPVIPPRPEPEQEPAEFIDNEIWKNRPWYFSAGIFWAPRFYSSDSMVSLNFANIGLGLYAEYCFTDISNEKLDFLKLFSIRTGLEFAPDWIIATTRIGDEYRNMIMQIPLLFNYVFKPDTFSMQKPYLGFTFNIPLFPHTTVPLLSLKAGYQYNRKIGPGIGFADASFSFDFGKSGLNKHNPNDRRQFSRFMLYFGIGYKFGIGSGAATNNGAAINNGADTSNGAIINNGAAGSIESD